MLEGLETKKLRPAIIVAPKMHWRITMSIEQHVGLVLGGQQLRRFSWQLPRRQARTSNHQLHDVLLITTT